MSDNDMPTIIHDTHPTRSPHLLTATIIDADRIAVKESAERVGECTH